MTQQKRSQKKSKNQLSARKVERGFDFGNRQPIVAVADTEFNQALIDAQIVACAYGYHQPPGFPGPIPALTLVGTHIEPLKRAFEAFMRWGCEEDGDVVDVNILLKKDGTYEMRIGPEADRTMFRIVGQPDLYQPLMVPMWWVKPFDSTHPMLRELKQYTSCRDKSRVKKLKEFFGNRMLSEITRCDVERFQTTLRGKKTPREAPRKGATVNRYVYLLSAIFSRPIRDEVVDSNPCSRFEQEPEATRERYLTPNEQMKLMEVLVDDLE